MPPCWVPSDVSEIVKKVADTFRYSAGTAVHSASNRHSSAGIGHRHQPGDEGCGIWVIRTEIETLRRSGGSGYLTLYNHWARCSGQSGWSEVSQAIHPAPSEIVASLI